MTIIKKNGDQDSSRVITHFFEKISMKILLHFFFGFYSFIYFFLFFWMLNEKKNSEGVTPHTHTHTHGQINDKCC